MKYLTQNTEKYTWYGFTYDKVRTNENSAVGSFV